MLMFNVLFTSYNVFGHNKVEEVTTKESMMHELISTLSQLFLNTLRGVGYATCATSAPARHHPEA